MQRIGIVLMSALGDVTLGLPVVTALRRARPDAHVTWIVQRGPDAIVARHPGVDEIVHFDRRAGLAAYPRIGRALAERRFDVLLDLQVALKAGLVTWLAHAAEKWGVDRARSRDANWLFTTHRLAPRPRAHMADQFLEFLAPLGVPAHDPAFGLVLDAECRDGAARWLAPLSEGTAPALPAAGGTAAGRPFAAVVVASSAAHKNWAPERIGQLCVELVERHDVRPVLVGGGSDTERRAAATIARACARLPAERRPVDALGSGIPALLGILDRAALVVSPDTGPLHLAVALRRPVIGLYGSTNPKWVGPYRWCHDLLVDRYGAEGEEYAASAARRPGRMAAITVDDVLSRVATWEARYRDAALRGAVPPALGASPDGDPPAAAGHPPAGLPASTASYTASVRAAV